MWQALRENPRAVTYAVLMHVGLLILLVFSLDWTPDAIKPGSPKAIKAELVDMSQLKAVEEKKLAEQRRIETEKRKLEQEEKNKVEEKSKAEQEEKKKVEEKRKAEQEVKQKAAAEKQRKADAERKKKAEADKQRKADAERKKKAEADKQRQADSERKKKAEQEAKKKAAAEKKRKQEAARQQEAERALQTQLAEEQAQARAEHALSEYIPYIQDKIQRSWRRPAGSPPGLTCLIQVRLIPGGEVVSAKVIRSSGDPLFDRSVETAVLKASPLPLPSDPGMFKYFREINFNFDPGR
jgi:colicin import membrane protein